MSSSLANDQANDQSAASHQRRSSLSRGLTDFFSGNRNGTAAYPGPITSAAQQANNRRRMSMSNVMGTSPPRLQTNMPLRRGSIASVSSAASSAVDENVIEDDENSAGTAPQPFARRLSFGARALRDIKVPASRAPMSAGAASPTVSRGSFPQIFIVPPPCLEDDTNIWFLIGFWQENTRSNSQGQGEESTQQQRRQSIAALPQPVNRMPVRSMTVDPMQERMLKGDFYFD